MLFGMGLSQGSQFPILSALRPQLFAEYEEVLMRPLCGFRKRTVTTLLSERGKTAVIVHPSR